MNTPSFFRSNFVLCFLAAAACLGLCASTSHAAIIAYDGFSSSDYTAGVIVGQDPTIAGFTGAWYNNSNISAGGAGNALTYSGVASDNTGGAYNNSNGGRAGRNFTTMLGGNGVAGTNVYYISLMTKVSALNAGYAAFELESQYGNRNFQFGSNADTGFLNWGMRVQTDALTFLTADSAVAPGANQTVFAVMKLTYSDVAGGDSVQLWINPTNLGSELLSTNSVSLTGFDFLHNSARDFQLAAWTTATSSWDEVRLGTAWSDVTTVPEPTTWALLSLSLTGVMIFRRRRLG